MEKARRNQPLMNLTDRRERHSDHVSIKNSRENNRPGKAVFAGLCDLL